MDIQRYIDEALAEYAVAYPCLGEGRNRRVFQINENFVVKVPLNEFGLCDNESEARAFAQEGYGGYVPYAECEVLHSKDGLPLLKMEFVKIGCVEDPPDWALSIDCAQIGWTQDNRLVAYDFGPC